MPLPIIITTVKAISPPIHIANSAAENASAHNTDNDHHMPNSGMIPPPISAKPQSMPYANISKHDTRGSTGSINEIRAYSSASGSDTTIDGDTA